VFLFLLQINVVIKMAEDDGKDVGVFLKQQPFAKPGTITTLCATFAVT
jgi:hypothetical protein